MEWCQLKSLIWSSKANWIIYLLDNVIFHEKEKAGDFCVVLFMIRHILPLKNICFQTIVPQEGSK